MVGGCGLPRGVLLRGLADAGIADTPDDQRFDPGRLVERGEEAGALGLDRDGPVDVRVDRRTHLAGVRGDHPIANGDRADDGSRLPTVGRGPTHTLLPATLGYDLSCHLE